MKDKIKAVIFDLDGTLTDTEKFYQKAWPQALEHFGWEVWPGQALELRSLGRPFAIEKFREWYGDDFDYEEVRNYRKQLIKEILDEQGIPLKPGCREILGFLRERGITTAIATANDLKRTMGYLEKIGIADLFDKVICADMVKQGKPAPDIYAHACRELGLAPSETYAVEDSPNGVRSAYGAGCNVIMIPDLTEPDEELSKMLFRRLDNLMCIAGLFK